MDKESKPGRLGVWLKAVRAFSFTASGMPVILAAAFALYKGADINCYNFPPVILCALLIHGASNLLNDYVDFKKGVDTPDSLGSSHVLTRGQIKPEEVFRAALLLYAGGFLLGLVLVMFSGWPLLIIGFSGPLGAYAYTGSPLGYKYAGWGDVMIFLLMGPVLMLGAYYALTKSLSYEIILVSLPVGFLVAAILASNNLRDIVHDKQAKIRTLAGLIGVKYAGYEYVGLITSAYIAVVLFAALGIVPWLSLLVFLSLPLSIKNIRRITKSSPENPKSLISIDIDSAQLHLAFTVLFTFALIIKAVLWD